MSSDFLGVVGFIVLCIVLLYLDSQREVLVHICESEGITSYVNREPPPKRLKLGLCHIEPMPNSEYGYLRNTFIQGARR